MTKRVTFDLDRTFSLSDAVRCYELTEQHIEVMLQVFPQTYWAKRWHGTGGKTVDEIKEFFADLSNRLLSPSDCVIGQDVDCLHYAPYASFISYSPMNPYTDPMHVPLGYLAPPFQIVGRDFNDAFYENGDVAVRFESITPFLGGLWDLTGNAPRIKISVFGEGTVELHFLNQIAGGRAVITVDRTANILDILADIILEDDTLVELSADVLSIPPEDIGEVIYEVQTIGDTNHDIYVAFLPVLDDSVNFIGWGGVLRSVHLCDVTPISEAENIVNDIRINNCELEKLVNGEWLPAGDITDCITDITNIIQVQVDDNETEILVNAGDISDNFDNISDNDNEIDDIQSYPQDTNTYPAAPTQETDAVALCGSAWNIAEQLEILCQNALTNGQTITLMEWLEIILPIGGFESSFLVQMWNFAFTNSNQDLSTELTSAIPEIAEILYCNDLNQSVTKTDIQANGSISVDAKIFYDAAIDSVTKSVWNKWTFIGSQDASRDCSAFCSSPYPTLVIGDDDTCFNLWDYEDGTLENLGNGDWRFSSTSSQAGGVAGVFKEENNQLLQASNISLESGSLPYRRWSDANCLLGGGNFANIPQTTFFGFRGSRNSGSFVILFHAEFA